MKTVVLTGESGYLGSEMLNVLLQDFNVIGLSRAAKKERVSECRNMNGRYVPLAVSLEEASEVEIVELVKDVECDLGSWVVGLVNNAIFGYPQKPNTIGKQEVVSAAEGILAVHLRLATAFGDLMIERQTTGSIVNITSMYGKVAPNRRIYTDRIGINPLLYGCMKAALIQGTKYLSAVYAKDGVRMNSVSFGPFPSEDVQRADPAFIERLSENTHIGRVGKAAEAAGIVRFLLSEDSSFITGTDISVDGGWTAW